MTEINQENNNNARKQVDDQTNGLNQVNQEADKNVISSKINEVKASEQIRKSIQEEARKIISNFCSSSVDSDNKRSIIGDFKESYLSSDSSKTLENTQLLSSESSSNTDTENNNAGGQDKLDLGDYGNENNLKDLLPNHLRHFVEPDGNPAVTDLSSHDSFSYQEINTDYSSSVSTFDNDSNFDDGLWETLKSPSEKIRPTIRPISLNQAFLKETKTSEQKLNTQKSTAIVPPNRVSSLNCQQNSNSSNNNMHFYRSNTNSNFNYNPYISSPIKKLPTLPNQNTNKNQNVYENPVDLVGSQCPTLPKKQVRSATKIPLRPKPIDREPHFVRKTEMPRAKIQAPISPRISKVAKIRNISKMNQTTSLPKSYTTIDKKESPNQNFHNSQNLIPTTNILQKLENRVKTLEAALAEMEINLKDEKQKHQLTAICLRNSERGRLAAEKRNEELQQEMATFFETFGELFTNHHRRSVIGNSSSPPQDSSLKNGHQHQKNIGNCAVNSSTVGMNIAKDLCPKENLSSTHKIGGASTPLHNNSIIFGDPQKNQANSIISTIKTGSIVNDSNNNENWLPTSIKKSKSNIKTINNNRKSMIMVNNPVSNQFQTQNLITTKSRPAAQNLDISIDLQNLLAEATPPPVEQKIEEQILSSPPSTIKKPKYEENTLKSAITSTTTTTAINNTSAKNRRIGRKLAVIANQKWHGMGDLIDFSSPGLLEEILDQYRREKTKVVKL